MNSIHLKYIGILVSLVLQTTWLHAQTGPAITMSINKEAHSEKTNLVQMTVALYNNLNQAFEGTLIINTPKGLKCISGKDIAIQLEGNAKQFKPISIIIQKNAEAGIAQIELILKDKNNNIITTETIEHRIAENKSVQLYPISSTIYLTDIAEEVNVDVGVNNSGNTYQDIALVVQIIDIKGNNQFSEFNTRIEVHQDTIISLPITLPKSTSTSPSYNVKISGLIMPGKEPFGFTSVTLQNASSERRYWSNASLSNNFQSNTLTASIRKIGNNTNMYQLLGSGKIDLPLGYLSLQGNVYYSDNGSKPIATNTSLSYIANNTELTFGNISEISELPLFGRGIKLAQTNDAKNKKLTIGIVDQNFNLFSENNLLENGGAAFANGSWFDSKTNSTYNGGYIIKYEPWENATHQVLSGEIQRTISKDWRFAVKGFGGISHYLTPNKLQSSGGMEAQYTGKLSNQVTLSGNYFYSSSYFPGNRRGALQAQQQISKRTKKGSSLIASVYYFNFSPEYINNLYETSSENFKAEAGIILPTSGKWGLRVFPQYQKERSLVSHYLTNNPDGKGQMMSLNAVRLINQISWSNPAHRQNIILSIEPGLATYPLIDKPRFQLRTNTIFTYKWLNFNAIYQQGAFFITEYIGTLQRGGDFKRLSLIASVKKNFFSNKLETFGGGSLFYDAQNGNTPSAFANIKYKPNDKYALFFNSNWFQYKNLFFGTISGRSIFNIEVGLTINFNHPVVSASKKARLKGFVYYDNNTNGIFDEGDAIAKNYHITFDKTFFRTDSTGYFYYTSVPFGTYKIGTQINKGWFTPDRDYVIDQYNVSIEIPLHKNGTAIGNIRYDFEENKVMDFTPKTEGIVISIYHEDELITRMPTNNSGVVTLMLPTGSYVAVLDRSSLAENTYCENNRHSFEVVSGKITKLNPFIIGVRQKTIRVKKFGQ